MSERELFLDSLLGWNMLPVATVLLGDFNSVQSPPLDRMGHWATSRPESPALGVLLASDGLSDARLLGDHADEDEAANTIDHGTRSATAGLIVLRGLRKSFGYPQIHQPNATLTINGWSFFEGQLTRKGSSPAAQPGVHHSNEPPDCVMEELLQNMVKRHLH